MSRQPFMPHPQCGKQPDGETNFASPCTREMMHRGPCSWDRANKPTKETHSRW